jgi:localization factor PodJL
VAARRRASKAREHPADEVGRVAVALDRLTDRIEAAEKRSAQAITGIDESVRGALQRLVAAEREQVAVAARFEGVVDEIKTDQTRAAERLRRIEAEAAGPRSAEALRALEGALGKVAGHLYEGEARTRETIAHLEQRLDNQAGVGAGDPSALVEEVVARLGQRLEAAEARTAEALQALNASFSALDGRLQTVESSNPGEGVQKRLDDLTGSLTQRMEAARMEMAAKLRESADGRFDRMERKLGEMTAHVQAAEQRSAQAIERMGREVVGMADALNRRVQTSEARNTAAIEQVAASIDQKLNRADSVQAQALEKLGAEIARITEKLAERIGNAERRNALAIDDVGDQVTRVTDRLNQRHERTSQELVDRIRQSEERTARLLEEAREKIDTKLGEAQRRLAEQAAAAPRRPRVPPRRRSTTASASRSAARPFPRTSSTSRPPSSRPSAVAVLHDPPAPPRRPPSRPRCSKRRPSRPANRPRWNSATRISRPPTASPRPWSRKRRSSRPPTTTATSRPPSSPPPNSRRPARAGRAVAPAVDPRSDRAGPRRRPPGRPLRRRQGQGQAEDQEGRNLAVRRLRRQELREEGQEGRDEDRADGLGHRRLHGRRRGRLHHELGPWHGSAARPRGPGHVAQGRRRDPHRRSRHQPGRRPRRRGPDLAGPPDRGRLRPIEAAAPATPPGENAQALYDDGVRRIEAKDRTGLDSLRKAANLGLPRAQFYLAKMYEVGEGGVKKDLVEARRWTERAATAGEARAMHNLALYYYKGEGGERNSTKAASWFRKASDLGLVDSQFNLAQLYEGGWGVSQNPTEAYKWYLIAARSGDTASRARAMALRAQLTAEGQRIAERSASGFRSQAAAPVQAVASAAAPSAGLATAQRALSKLGYYQGPQDGVTSPALQMAIAAYQRDQNLQTSGALDGETLSRLSTWAR